VDVGEDIEMTQDVEGNIETVGVGGIGWPQAGQLTRVVRMVRTVVGCLSLSCGRQV